MRGPAIDRNLVLASLGLMLFGLATLYSAGQTDVPTRAAGVWHRQFVCHSQLDGPRSRGKCCQSDRQRPRS